MKRFAPLLFLVLAACADQDREPTGASATSSPDSRTETAKPVSHWSGVVNGVRHEVFSDQQSCMDNGFTQEQCRRANAAAMGGMALDPPRYPSQEACLFVFHACSQWPTGSYAGLYSPRPIGFSIGGEARGASGPTKEHPSVYAAVFMNKDHKPVMAIQQPTGAQVLPLLQVSQPSLQQ